MFLMATYVVGAIETHVGGCVLYEHMDACTWRCM